MFVRFRICRNRLMVSVVDTRRVGRKVQHKHISGLGGINVETSVADRIKFWQAVYDRLPTLADRIDAAAQAKILAALQARIPIVTPEEHDRCPPATLGRLAKRRVAESSATDELIAGAALQP
jgi:hypothetical protein